MSIPPFSPEQLKASKEYLNSKLEEIREHPCEGTDPTTGKPVNYSISEETAAWVKKQLLEANAQVMQWKKIRGN